MKRGIQIAISILFIFISVAVLALSIRGHFGAPTKQNLNDYYWTNEGPFELSPDRGRFALLFSLVNDKSFHFDTPIAQFATPDLGYINGKFVSLFAPGLSFITIPGYLLGSTINLGQVGIFAEIALFGLLNMVLIIGIAKLLGGRRWAAFVAGLTFLFATPAFAYAVSYYQHHVTTSFLLLGIWLVLKYPKKLYSFAAVWALAAFSISIDYTNAVIFSPLGLYTLWIMVRQWASEKKSFRSSILHIATFLAVIPPLLFFAWTNYSSYGSPFQLAGTVKQIQEIDATGRPIEKLAEASASAKTINTPIKTDAQNLKVTEKKSAIGFFQTRKLLNGFYILLISPDRGILYFAPVLFLSIFGFVILYLKKPAELNLLLGTILLTFLLYSMWGDPWGGWAFGGRYLIPAYSILCISIAILLTHYKKNIVFLLFYLLIFIYSSFVNSAGAITFNLNPPQVEVLSLEQQTGNIERYSFDRNLNYLKQNGSKSFAFEVFAKQYVNASEYHLILFSLIVLLCVIALICLFIF